jgi:hypothetical protein
MKNTLLILIGVIVGVIGVFLYRVFGVAVLPPEPADTQPERKASSGYRITYQGTQKSLADTQPVMVEAPWNELGYDCGEPWGEPTIGGIRE